MSFLSGALADRTSIRKERFLMSDSEKRSVICIDKVYIDGLCGPKKLAGVLLARFERVSHVTHFYKKDLEELCVYSMIGIWNFPTQMFAVRLGPRIF